MYNNCFPETISIEEYTSIWKQIREVLLRLGGPPIRVRLHRIENEVLDAEMQTHYINKVNENWSSNHKRIVFTPKSSSSRNTKGKTKRKNKAEQEGKTKFMNRLMFLYRSHYDIVCELLFTNDTLSIEISFKQHRHSS